MTNVLEEQCGVKVFHLEVEPQGTAASTQSAGFGNAVLFHKKNPKWRRNFDLAHELFHLLTWNFAQATQPRAAVWSESDEKLADEFAACLLMPAGAVFEAVGHRLQDRKLPLVGLFEVARQFDVSVEAPTWRIARESARELGPKMSLFFCQSRALTEAVADEMRADSIDVYVHNGSVSKEEQREAEEKFAQLTNACVVAASTLELGIDVGGLNFTELGRFSSIS